MLRLVGRSDPSLRAILENPKEGDLDENNLSTLLKQNAEETSFGEKLYPRVILWADMLIYNKSKNQHIKSVVGLLKSLLKKNEEPVVSHGFLPIDMRYRKIQAKTEAAMTIDQSEAVTLREEVKVQEMSRRAWERYTPTQKEKIINAIKEKYAAFDS